MLVVVKKQPLKRKQNTNRFKRSQFKIISYLFLLGWKYSKYCQGNTKTNKFDIFEIAPEVAYSDDYDTVVDDVKKEQQEKARPKIKNKIKNIDEYETIYVGYPNWWGEMPMILYIFFEDYDLSNKTITLFCTSGGSGLSDTEKTIQALEPSAPMVKGLYVSKSASKEATSDAKEWVNEIK